MKNIKDTQDSVYAAKLAGLIYVSDTHPGISRRRAGKGFMYLNSKGKLITNTETKERIKSLAIPPAYNNVWICPHDNGHIQATGIDDKERKQYLYHPEWNEIRRHTKYHRMISFGQHLPKIRRKVRTDLAKPGLPKDKILATVVSLLEKTSIRIGNARYMKRNNSYGLTTLKHRHVEVDDQEIHFNFKGKRGKQQEKDVDNEKLAHIVNSLQELPGQTLFQYKDDNETLHRITSTDINLYLKDITGQDFTAKDFRTWKGTVLAFDVLQKKDVCSSNSEANKNIKEAIDQVAVNLGNTPAISRKSYIHPALIQKYKESLCIEVSKTDPDTNKGLKKSEIEVMSFLKENDQIIDY